MVSRFLREGRLAMVAAGGTAQGWHIESIAVNGASVAGVRNDEQVLSLASPLLRQYSLYRQTDDSHKSHPQRF